MKNLIVFIILAIVIICFVKIAKAEAPLIPERTLSEYSPQEMIVYYGNLYGASTSELLITAKCESNFKKDIYGDHGKAYSIFQFHEPTFDRFSDLMGEELDYKSYQDNVKLASWVFAKHPELKKHWSCFTKFY